MVAPPPRPLDLIFGALAGAAGVWALDRVDWRAYRAESSGVRARTVAARPDGADPAHVLANRAGAALDYRFDRPDRHAAGLATHYARGILPGALYAAFRSRAPWLTTGNGTAFGLALFLLQDELLNSAAGLAGRPRDYPWQAHARGLVAHLVHGLVLESSLHALQVAAARIDARSAARVGPPPDPRPRGVAAGVSDGV